MKTAYEEECMVGHLDLLACVSTAQSTVFGARTDLSQVTRFIEPWLTTLPPD
jgi:hypothetical protein